MRLKSRERELRVFADVLAALKSAAAYTAGDLYALLALCRENAFLHLVQPDADLYGAWEQAARAFFTRRGDAELACAFIRGYGKTDLEGQLAYIGLFEARGGGACGGAPGRFCKKQAVHDARPVFRDRDGSDPDLNPERNVKRYGCGSDF